MFPDVSDKVNSLHIRNKHFSLDMECTAVFYSESLSTQHLVSHSSISYDSWSNSELLTSSAQLKKKRNEGRALATLLFLLSSPMGSSILHLLLQCQDLASSFVLKILEEKIVC